jgi:poly(A) polymerase/tRNA nucleotidyltransferase (CCA-adding enzyme)
VITVPGLDAVWDALPEARIAGGAVRDALAGRAVADVDLAVPLTPEAVIARVSAAGLKAVPTGLAHGTVTVLSAKNAFEVTSLRRDVETDGRHAVVAFTDDWEADASRRDFTINAMSADRAGTVYDYFGGRADLSAGRVRFVGVAAARIEEDYLRILRFFRFYARYARGEADAEAVGAIRALRDGVLRLSAERVWMEMKRIFAAADPRAALALMAETGVLALVMPGARMARFDGLVARGAPVDPLLRVAALLDGPAADFAAQWRLSGAELARLEGLLRPAALSPGMADADLRRALADAGADVLVDQAWLADDGDAGWQGLRARIAAMPAPVFPLQGRDVTALGVMPGPRVGELLAAARDWWLAGGCVAERATCLEFLRKQDLFL